VYHRDLKLENALINISAESAPYLKIADFGFSKVLNMLLRMV
jgi:serine/threonine protein kinase